MAKFINMPKMGNTVTSVIFSEWHVKEGDVIKEGDKLFSYETDKTTTDEFAKESGTILKLLVQPDEEVLVFAPVMVIGAPSEEISSLLKNIKVKEKPTTVSTVQTSSKQESPLPEVETLQIKPQSVVKTTKEIKPTLINEQRNEIGGISPRALRMLRQSGIPINKINYGTGPRGRIVSDDITQAMNLKNLNKIQTTDSNPLMSKINDIVSKATNEGDEKFVYTPMRAAISKGMKKSQQDSAFVTLSMTIDSSKLLAARQTIKKAITQGGLDISINDLIIFATSRVLPKYSKTINAHVFDTEAIGHHHANIAVAVDTPIGLIVPVIKQANLKSLDEISQETKKIISIVRKGEYKGVDLNSGTFTISNVGGMGIEMFTPVLNAGQAGILGVGTSMIRPRQNKNGLIEFYNAMILSLTVDHRLVDGADGARFLNDLKLVLENIDLIM